MPSTTKSSDSIRVRTADWWHGGRHGSAEQKPERRPGERADIAVGTDHDLSAVGVNHNWQSLPMYNQKKTSKHLL